MYVYMQINEAIDNDQAHLLMQLAFVLLHIFKQAVSSNAFDAELQE